MKKATIFLMFIVTLTGLFAQPTKTYYSLEEALQNPEQVYKLDLSMQKISELSPEIGKLKNLEMLDLSFNIFSDLPQELAELENLKTLKLTGCRRMPKLPEVITKIPNLKELELFDIPEWKGTKIKIAIESLPNVKVLHD